MQNSFHAEVHVLVIINVRREFLSMVYETHSKAQVGKGNKQSFEQDSVGV